MHLRALSMRDFRSWREFAVDLEPGITVFTGRNGYGKTNIVEAVGYLSTLSSHRVSTDPPLVRAGAENARISATAVNDGRELTAHLLIAPHAANLAQLNRTRMKSPREILGTVRSVFFAPEDLELVKGEPAKRRRYLDDLLAIRRPRLAGARIEYEHNYPAYYPQAQSNPQKPWAYPDKALPAFRQWFRHEYLPTKYPKYVLTKQHLLGGQQKAKEIASLYQPKQIEKK